MSIDLCQDGASNVMLSNKGSFSYKQDNVKYLTLDDYPTIKFERSNNNVARVYLVDAQQVHSQFLTTSLDRRSGHCCGAVPEQLPYHVG